MPEMRGEQSTVIQAPVDVVYAYVSDFPRHVEWNHQPGKMTQMTDGPVGVGARFRTEEEPPRDLPWLAAKVIFPVMSMLVGFKPYTEAEITELVQDQRIAWKAAAPSRGGYAMKADWEINLSAVDDGTRVTQRFHFRPQHWLVNRTANDQLAQQIESEIALNLEKLKSIITQ